MTAQQPPRNSDKNPNLAPKSSSDAKATSGACPLMKNKVQLLPLRYGLVERCNPKAELPMPYSLKSRPLGIRLLRDGWLYVIVDRKPKPILHEYRIEKGLITQLLWNGAEVSADTRTSNVGEAKLIFRRDQPLHVAYAEIQWTAAKCSQVLKSAKERDYFMQAADLRTIDCTKGGTNLLTEKQANQWLAEVAETTPNSPVIQGAKPEETLDYAWEHAPLFKKTQLGALKKGLNPLYEHDHLYLVIRDDLGVLRDLAAHQDLVVDWVSDWSSAETNNKKYVVGCYIESLYSLNEARLLKAAKDDPRFAKLEQETTPEQRQSISDYINVKYKTQWNGPGTHSGAIKAAQSRMRQSLGESLYERYEDFIESLDENAEDALEGAKIGQRGINDLVNRPAMEAFLRQQRNQLTRWNNRLDLITEDRVAMLERFYRSAWYFDAKSSRQVEAALATEYACLKDLCRSEKSTQAMATLLDKRPELSLPTFFTLSHTDQVDMQAKLIGFTKAIRDLRMVKDDYQGANELSLNFKGLVEQRLPAVFNLSTDGVTLDQARNTAYEPAKQLRLANAMESAMQGLRTGAPFDPAKVLRNLPGSAWLDVLRAFGKGGITLEFASINQIRAFEADTAKLQEMRSQLTSLKNRIRQTLALERRGRLAKGTHRALAAERNALKQAIQPLESRVAAAISPVGEGPSKAGVKIKGLNSTQVVEFQRMVEDFNMKRPFKGLAVEVFKSYGADVFASAVAVMQIRSFLTVASELSRKKEWELTERLALGNAFFSMTGGVFAAAQGIAVTSLSTAMKNYTSVAGKVHMAARLGKLTASFGFPAYVSSALASSISLKDNLVKWGEGLRRGDGAMLAGASMSALGDAGQVGLNGWATVRTTGIVLEVLKDTQQARAVAWAAAGGRLLSIAARANLIGLALTGLQLGGEWLYNRNNLSKLDEWLLQGPWGVEDAKRSLQEEHLRLADITTGPQAELQAGKNGPLVVLSIPSVVTGELDASRLSLSGYWMTHYLRNEWEPWSEQLLYQFTLLSKLDEPLKLGLEVFPNEANAMHGLAFQLRYHPLSGIDALREKRFETITLYTTSAKPLSEVALLRTRTLNAPWLPVTLDTLSQHSPSQQTG